MAEERNLAVARAVEGEAGAAADEDSTKAELQRRMEEARESITQTVTEIKDTVANQYQAVRQSVTDALDWREQYRRRPVVWSVGALSVGFLVGYSLGGAFMGDGEDQEDYLSYDEDYDAGSTAASSSGVSYPPYDSERVRSAAPSYAAQSVASASYGQRSSSPATPQRVSDYQSAEGGAAEAAEPDKPGILERFKETRAYDRLQEEVSSLGDRLLDELSNVGQTVVLPMLFNKVKDMFGVDLSNKQKGQRGSGGSTGASGTSNASTGGTQAAGSTDYSRREEDRSQTGGSVSGSAGASYGTSENRGYGS